MNWRERITSDPDVLAGKPIIDGTRLSVSTSWSFWRTGGAKQTF